MSFPIINCGGAPYSSSGGEGFNGHPESGGLGGSSSPPPNSSTQGLDSWDTGVPSTDSELKSVSDKILRQFGFSKDNYGTGKQHSIYSKVYPEQDQLTSVENYIILRHVFQNGVYIIKDNPTSLSKEQYPFQVFASKASVTPVNASKALAEFLIKNKV